LTSNTKKESVLNVGKRLGATRIDPAVKKRAAAVLEELGITELGCGAHSVATNRQRGAPPFAIGANAAQADA